MSVEVEEVLKFVEYLFLRNLGRYHHHLEPSEHPWNGFIVDSETGFRDFKAGIMLDYWDFATAVLQAATEIAKTRRDKILEEWRSVTQ